MLAAGGCDPAMFLHLLQADLKFLKPIRNCFEAAAPGQHVYVFLSDGDISFPVPEYATLVRKNSEFSRVMERFDNWQGVIVHGVILTVFPMLRLIPPHLKIAWYSWGAEAYTMTPGLENRLFLPHTKNVLARLKSTSLLRRLLARGRLLSAIRSAHHRCFCWPKIRTVTDRYALCVPQVREEYDLFKKYGLLTHTQYQPGSVGSLEDTVDVHSDITSPGPDIQIGNSAYASNNHADAFFILRSFNLHGRKLITPLSYGPAPYRDMILEIGQSMFGDSFCPLVDFLPLAEYNQLMQRCGVVVMNNCRQQAVGNLIAALWRGARVYMNDTTVYRGYRRMGFDIGLIATDLHPDNPKVFEPLTHDEVLHRRQLLRRTFGRDVIVEQTRMLLRRMQGN